MKALSMRETRTFGRQALCVLVAVMLLVGMAPIAPTKAQALEPEDLLQLFSEHLEYYLPFDGNSASVTQAATTENGVTYEQGKFGQAARFNSQTDYVKLDGITEYPADYSFSIALWVKDGGSSGDPGIFSNKAWSGASPGFIFAMQPDGSVRFNANAPGKSRVDRNTSATLRDNTWHHFAGVVNRQTGRTEMYIDGASVGDCDISRFAGQPFTALDTMIGNDGTGAYGAANNALIDDFFLFDTALDAETIGALYGMDDNIPRLYFADSEATLEGGDGLAPVLVKSDGATPGAWAPVQYTSTDTSLFTVDPATGAIIANSAGATGSAYLVASTVWNNTLPLTASLKVTISKPITIDNLLQLFSDHMEYYLPFDGNSVSTTSKATTENGVTYEQGKFGYAARFNDSSAYVKLNERTEYPADYSFSIALWIKDGGNDVDPSVFSNKDWRSGANPGFIFAMQPDGSVRFNANTPGKSRVDRNTSATLRDNTWHHFAGVVNRQTGRTEIYIDGASVGDYDISRFAGQPFTALDTMIGNDGTGAYRAAKNTLIDDFFLFDTALDATAVTELYEASGNLPRLHFSDSSLLLGNGETQTPALVKGDGVTPGSWAPVQYVSTDTSLFTVDSATGQITANSADVTGSAYLIASTTWNETLSLTAALEVTVGPIPISLTLAGANSATIDTPFLVDVHFNSGAIAQSFKSVAVTFGYDPAVLEFVPSYRATGATYIDDPVSGTLKATYSFGDGKILIDRGPLRVAGRIGTFCFKLKADAPKTSTTTSLEVKEVMPIADGRSDSIYEKTLTGLEIATSLPPANDTNGDGLVSIGDISNSEGSVDAAAIAADAGFGFYPVKRVVYLGIDGGGNFLAPEGYYTTDNSNYIWAGKPQQYRYELFEGAGGLAETGSYTPNALAANPTVSGQNWTAMFHGYDPVDSAPFTITNERAGNWYYPVEESPYSSIFACLREAQPNRTQSTFIEWGPIEGGIIDNNTGAYQYRGGSNDPLRKATQMIGEGFLLDSSFMFIDTDHYMDGVGHSTGWYNNAFYNAAAVEVADIEKLVEAIYSDPDIKDDTVLMIGNDHGGNGTAHGGWTLQEKYVMMYARGPVIKAGHTYSGDNGTIGESDNADARQKDWPALFARAMGIAGDPDWLGTTANHDIFLTQKEMAEQGRGVETIELVEKSDGYTVELAGLRDENSANISAAHLVISGGVSPAEVTAAPGAQIVRTALDDGKLTVIVKADAVFAEGPLLLVPTDAAVALENAMLGKLDGREVYTDLAARDDSSNPIAPSADDPYLTLEGPTAATAGDTLDYTVSLGAVKDTGTIRVDVTPTGTLEFLEATSLDASGKLSVASTKKKADGTVSVILTATELPGITLDAASPVLKLSFKATAEGQGSVTLTKAEGASYIYNGSQFEGTADIEVALPEGADATITTAIAKYIDPYDFNRDDKVTLADLTYVQAFYMASADTGGYRWAHAVERGMDLDASGTIDVADLILIIDHLYEIEA